MRNLRLVGLSSDGQQVVYVDDAGVEFLAPADDRLRAALRGDRARLGQLEIEMDSTLRPRDIQARIRSGDTPEGVAGLAGVPVERVMPFCVPVLAERRHVAETAGRCHVRRANADGQSRRLADVVAERLRGRGVAPDSAEWDAWRRDDSRWTVQLTYLSGESARSAAFVFDPAGRYSLADDDEARWLTGERQTTVHGPQPRETAQPTAGDRRLAVVPSDDEDLLTLASDDDLGVAESHNFVDTLAESVEVAGETETADDLTAVVRAVRESAAADPSADAASPEAAADTDDTATDEPSVEPRPARRGRGSRRASVPTWDEIMLGRKAEH